MAELSTIARPYAKAAFEFARESGNIDGWFGMLDFSAQVVSNAEVADLLENPEFSGDQKGEALLKICGDQLDEKGANFIRLLAQNHRLTALPAIRDRFEHLKAEYEKTIEVDVVSAQALEEKQVDALAEKLSTKLGRKVRINNTTDSALIGGMVIRAEDLVIDGSVRGKLEKLSETLRA